RLIRTVMEALRMSCENAIALGLTQTCIVLAAGEMAAILLIQVRPDCPPACIPIACPSPSVGRMIYHVLNRGNGRQALFRKDEDYAAFLRVLKEAQERYPVRLYALCLMPSHWHLVVRPQTDSALGDMMRWVGVT